jgi:hypothetical protein
MRHNPRFSARILRRLRTRLRQIALPLLREFIGRLPL